MDHCSHITGDIFTPECSELWCGSVINVSLWYLIYVISTFHTFHCIHYTVKCKVAAVADPARPGHQELVGAGAVPQEGTAAGEFGQGKAD